MEQKKRKKKKTQSFAINWNLNALLKSSFVRINFYSINLLRLTNFVL